MVITPFRLFLFVVAAFLAAGGTAYYTGALDAYFAPAQRQVAKQDAQGGAEPAATDTSKPAAETAKTEPASAGDGQAKSADAPEAGGGKQAGQVVVPAFDIVRVEPDGSMVVAGHAAPESNVEVVSGSTIVGKAQSGPGGDFAVVLDEPLKPGNHQIVLRSTTPKDVVATSKETAVVSVPDTKNGEVLALVEAPGKPSRLITKPKAKEDGATQEAAASQGAADKAGAQASGEKAEQAQPHVAMAEPPASADKDAGTAGSSAADAGAMKAGSSEAASQAEQSAGNKAGTAGSASAGKADTSTPNDTAAAAGETAPAKPAAGNSVASADAAGKEKIPAGEKNDVKVFIEAVEIDGKDVFVAGGGVPGQRVRVYANDILLGDAVVSPNGRFLVQTTRELPVGDYIVRADLLSDDGAEVIARAAVPFEREPGEKLAAVAPSSPASDEEQKPAGDKEPAAASGNAATEEGSGAAATAPRVASKVPDSEDTQAGSASETEKAGAAEPHPANNADASGVASAGTTDAGAGAAAAAGTTEANAATEAGANAAASAGVSQTSPATGDKTPAGTTETGSGADERIAAADAKGGMKLPDLHNGVAENAPVITAPKLESVDGAVIIRRGDTLWQISRRVYGRGVRYSTIYLANQEQIRNPDMIWPGQVFSVPQETKDGQAADMKAIGEQAVPADMAGTEPEWRR